MKTFNRRGFIYSSSQVYEYSMELSVLELISYSGMKLYQLVFNGMNLVCAAGLTTKSFCQKNKNKKNLLLCTAVGRYLQYTSYCFEIMSSLIPINKQLVTGGCDENSFQVYVHITATKKYTYKQIYFTAATLSSDITLIHGVAANPASHHYQYHEQQKHMEIALGRRSKLLYISFVCATSGSILCPALRVFFTTRLCCSAHPW